MSSDGVVLWNGDTDWGSAPLVATLFDDTIEYAAVAVQEARSEREREEVIVDQSNVLFDQRWNRGWEMPWDHACDYVVEGVAGLLDDESLDWYHVGNTGNS